MEGLGAVFWDVDGTISNTEINGHLVAFNKSFEHFQLPWVWDEKTYVDLLSISGGIRRVDYYSKKVGFSLDRQTLLKVIEHKRKSYEDIVNSGILSFRPGVRRLMEELSSLDITQIIVSTGRKESVLMLLQNLFNSKSLPFTQFVTFENVENHKPNPEAYILAVKLSQIHPTNCLAIEDSNIGLIAAKKANLSCLVTLSPWINHPTSKMRIADSVVNHLGEVSNKNKLFIGPEPFAGIVTSTYLRQLLPH